MTTGTSIEDPKNRAFEAIARREAHELQLQEKNRYNKRPFENCGNFNKHKTVASSASASNTPFKKGKYSFSGQTTTRDAEEDHPIYLPLSHPVHENLATTNLELNVVDKILHELLQNGDSSQNYVQGSRRMKIDNRVHLDNKVQERNMSGVALAKALPRHSKRSRMHMSMKQLKKCGVLDLPHEIRNFEMLKPMHETWKSYIMQHLKNFGKSQIAQCLLGASLDGAHILVAQCKMVAFAGVSGIVVRETAETFGIFTKDNKFKVVLKKISVFMLQVDCWKITLHGDKLVSRKIFL